MYAQSSTCRCLSWSRSPRRLEVGEQPAQLLVLVLDDDDGVGGLGGVGGHGSAFRVFRKVVGTSGRQQELRTSKMTMVSRAEISSDPRQPTRLEKKKNMLGTLLGGGVRSSPGRLSP